MERPTEQEIRDYCTEHAASIKVRVLIAGRGHAKTLAELTPEELEPYIEHWFERGMYPHRVTYKAASG